MDAELLRALVIVGACVGSVALGAVAPSLVALRLDAQNQQLRLMLAEAEERARKLKLSLEMERFHGRKTQVLPPRGG